jgi:hypothetical protein
MSMRLPALLLLLATSALAGCAGAKSESAGGSGAGGSIGTTHCTTIACVPAVTGSLSLAIEIDPPTNATTATVTELPTVSLSVEPIPAKELMADAQASVSVFFTATANAAAPSSGSVVLTVPTAIPGRPDLTFQAPTVGGASASVISASLTVPQTAVMAGQTATLALIPLPPADQQSPPYSFPVTLAPMLAQSLPSDNFTISGTLLSAYGTPPMATFVARAYQDGALVSNAPVMPGGITAATDPFKLLLPSAVTANGDPLTIQLTPQGQTPADPWFASNPIAPQANATALAVTLPAYSNLNQFNVIVKGDNGTAVSGALVHAQTVVGTSTLGSTEFARDGLADVNGTVVLSLLPGTAQAALNYQITVVPPANSAFAIPCDSPVAVTVGGSTTTTIPAPTLTTIMLAARPTMVGTVRDNQGYPLSNVAITATQETPDNASCTSATPAPASATTAADGTFMLALDPGTYQIDYDPPVGSAAPRFTEYGVPVTGSASLTHDETLPQGAAVTGTVVDTNGAALSSATVRLFQVRCMGGADCTGPNRTAPALRGVAVTDGNGSFRVAVASSATP